MKRRTARRAHLSIRTIFEDGMYGVALVAPIITIPQLLLIWTEHKTAGVSLITWTAFTVLSGIWLIYGMVEKQKPMILTQSFLFVIDMGVVIGVCWFR